MDYSEEGSPISFNFWPSYADLMLSLSLILIIAIVVVWTAFSARIAVPSHVKESQDSLIESFSSLEQSDVQRGKDTVYVYLASEDNPDITIIRRPTTLRFSFADNILFSPNSDQINAQGRRMLTLVGNEIKTQLSMDSENRSIKEIQIQGHADDTRTFKYGSNLNLAAQRAMRVFEFFQYDLGIDPTNVRMSATSFGEYIPVTRDNDDLEFGKDALRMANKSANQRARNRRIEMVISNY